MATRNNNVLVTNFATKKDVTTDDKRKWDMEYDCANANIVEFGN